jgi:hypothetical protein
MNTGKPWQQVAERLAGSGWSWQHKRVVARTKRNVHVAEAHNDEGEQHVVVAEAIAPAFTALERSITVAQK